LEITGENMVPKPADEAEKRDEVGGDHKCGKWRGGGKLWQQHSPPIAQCT
jgi:hypothetical protein